MQSVHGVRCCDNIAPNAKCQRVLVLALCLVLILRRCVTCWRNMLGVGLSIWISQPQLRFELLDNNMQFDDVLCRFNKVHCLPTEVTPYSSNLFKCSTT